MESRVKKRKICVITGTRAEYGLLKPVMEAIRKTKNLSLEIIATGMHLSPKFGSTVKEIEKDGFKIAVKVKMTPGNDSSTAMAKSIGEGIIGMTRALARLKPEIVLVLGDRVEALAAAISAAYQNIIVAHIHGGDSPRAGLDEYARHAVTKIAHIHFPATKKSARRIIKMGEDKWRIFTVGAPGLDSILDKRYLSRKEVVNRYNLDSFKPMILVLQHSVTTEIEDAPKQMKETTEAIRELGFQSIVIYPNADAGGRRMIKVIEKYRKYPFIKIFKNIPYKDYLSLMKVVSVLVGNSSSGIIEAPSFYLPVVNIGIRQEGRERTKNVIDVDYNKAEIKKAIKRAIFDNKFREKIKKCKNPYGKGKAGIKIAKILSKMKINKKLLQKKLTY